MLRRSGIFGYLYVNCFICVFSFRLLNKAIVRDKAQLEQLNRIMENSIRCESNESTKALPGVHCPKEFDNILCWPETPANQWAYQQCPPYVIGFENTNERAKRFCNEDGTWMHRPNSNKSYTDYRSCFEDKKTDELLTVRENLSFLINYLTLLSFNMIVFERVTCQF
jgi:hypothetical protein